MQETKHNETGEIRREFFAGDDAAMVRHMNRRLRELKGQGETFVRRRKIGRNEPCPCNSGLKFKKCCLHLAQRC